MSDSLLPKPTGRAAALTQRHSVQIAGILRRLDEQGQQLQEMAATLEEQAEELAKCEAELQQLEADYAKRFPAYRQPICPHCSTALRGARGRCPRCERQL